MKRTAILLIIIILFIFLTGCSNDEPIKIGFSATLSGKSSILGLNVRDGLNLAVEEINKKGGIKGRKVKLYIRNDCNSPVVARQVDRELIDKGVVTIIGHVTSDMTLASISLFNNKDMLLLGPTISTNQFTDINDNFIRVYPPNVFEQLKMARYARDKLGLERVAIIYDLDNRTFSEDWCQGFSSEFYRLGGKLVTKFSFRSQMEDLSYSSVLNKALSKKVEGILFVANAIDTAMFCQQLGKKNIDIPVLSSGWAMTESLLEKGGSRVEGIVLPNTWDNNCQQKEYLEFSNNFRERYHRKPGFAATYGYETINILFEALRNIDNISPQDIKNYIISKQTFQGVQGKIFINKNGDSRRKVYLFRVEDNCFRRLTESEER